MAEGENELEPISADLTPPKWDTAVRLVPTKPDAEIAAEIKDRLRQAIETHVFPILNEGLHHGLELNMNIGPDGFKRYRINTLELLKRY